MKGVQYRDVEMRRYNLREFLGEFFREFFKLATCLILKDSEWHRIVSL